jgi:hypothetical protein
MQAGHARPHWIENAKPVLAGRIGVVNFDSTKGCIKVAATERCGSFYTHATLKVGDRVHAWVQSDPALLPNGAEIYVVVPERR